MNTGLVSIGLAVASLLIIAPVLAAEASSTQRNFTAQLSGDEEVPAVDTQATGAAKFQLNKDGDELSYKLIVANIDKVSMSHIHLAPAGENGPVVAFLYNEAPSNERSDGVLAEGVITSADLVGPMSGMTISDLVAEIQAGNTYVNVHTTDFPGGEIRGQIS